MDAQFCIICKHPILGYWHELGKNKIICQSCASFTTVYDLFQCGIIDIKPDIIDAESAVCSDSDSLVTKDSEEEFPFDGNCHYNSEGCPLKKETCVDCEYDNGMVC